jgi:hypothetical protein
MRRLKPTGNAIEIGLEILRRCARLASPDRHGHPASAPVVLIRLHPEWTGRPWHVDVVGLWIHRHIRKDTDDRVWAIVHLDAAADDLGISLERALPVLVAQDQRSTCLCGIVRRDERSSKQWADAQRVEVIPRDDARRDARRLPSSEEDEVHVVILDDRVHRCRR